MTMPPAAPAACIVGIAGPELQPDEEETLRTRRPAGVILFARNIVDPSQLRALTAAVRGVLPDAVLMVDQEGGRVARLRPPHWPAHPSAGAIGRLHSVDERAGLRAAWLTGALIGLDCAEAGFNVVCAPVLDLRLPGANAVIGDRGYGDAPAAVARLGREMAAGLLAAGIQPVGKHAPGHGRAQVDSHLDLPVVDENDLEADLAPFAANADLPWMMTAHIRYPAWDPEAPATLSASIIDRVIRGRIGFGGVLVSDDLTMKALSGTQADLARSALAAGCDLALSCGGDPSANAGLLAVVPPMTPAAVGRLAAARALAGRRRVSLDRDALRTERDALSL